MRHYFLYILLLSLSSLAIAQDSQSTFLTYYEEYLEHIQQGDYEESIHVLNLSLKDCPNLSAYSIVWIYNHIGGSYWELGNFDRTIQYYEDAVDLSTVSEGVSAYLQNSNYINLAIVYRQLGDKNRALKYYKEADRLLEDLNTKDAKYNSRLSASLLNQGIVYYELHDYSTAIAYLEKARIIKEEKNHEFLGSVFLNLARSYEKQEDLSQAEDYYRKSIIQWEKEFGKSHYQLGGVYTDYGSFLLVQKGDSSSLEYFQKAIDIYMSYYGSKNASLSNAYSHLAEYYYITGLFEDALTANQQALIALCPDFNDTSIFANPEEDEALLEIDLIKNLYRKAEYLYNFSFADSSAINRLFAENEVPIAKLLDQRSELLLSAKESADLAISRMIKLHESFPSQESQLFLIENYKKNYLSGLQISYALFEASANSVYIENAYAYASRSKALELDFEKQEKERIYLNNSKDSSYHCMIGLANKIAAIENLIQNTSSRSLADSLKLLNWEKELFALRSQYEKEILIFRSKSDRVPQETDESFSSCSNLQKKLKRNEVIIEYTLSPPTEAERFLYTFLISRSDVNFYKQPIDSSFCYHCQNAINSLQDPSTSSKKIASKDYSIYFSLNHLYRRLIEPHEKRIAGKKLIIIPDEELIRIPFEALMKKNEETMKVENFLTSDHAIYYLHSSREYLSEKHLDFKAPSLSVIFTKDKTGDDKLYKNLIWAEKEGHKIANLYKGEFIENVKKDQLKNLIENEDMLHFAMHANAGDENSSPNLLVGPNTDSLFTNQLFDYEVNSLNSKAELVVLSACETGGGELYSGEGILNMSRSFSLAGVKAVIHSLWLIDDKCSYDVMTSFYKWLKHGKSKSTALQKAKLEYLENQSPSFRHPYYWSGYQLYGDDSSLDRPRSLYMFWTLTLLLVLLVFSIRRFIH